MFSPYACGNCTAFTGCVLNFASLKVDLVHDGYEIQPDPMDTNYAGTYVRKPFEKVFLLKYTARYNPPKKKHYNATPQDVMRLAQDMADQRIHCEPRRVDPHCPLAT